MPHVHADAYYDPYGVIDLSTLQTDLLANPQFQDWVREAIAAGQASSNDTMLVDNVQEAHLKVSSSAEG